ncbi:helix-turn-helix domain-containing protein [Apilactobacillus ozensis]|uniref:helix-turn-helix domain-containing protein n=1 Tax=Apilactobacillus ozensis TaxID=866801 RepID=UPI0025AEE8CE|nr:helix-turn-helix transcriptional regulator [Apilactobacillus ozensis]
MKKNLTQEQLANNLQVSRSTISSWETGRSYPDLEMIVRICDFFNVSLDYILRNDEKIVRKISLDSRKKKNISRFNNWINHFYCCSIYIIFILR